MNTINLIGRLTKEPSISEINIQGASKKMAKYTLAVERENSKDVDYICCSVIDKGADWLEKYIKKGSRIGVTGSLRIQNYELDKKIYYKAEVIVSKQYFA